MYSRYIKSISRPIFTYAWHSTLVSRMRRIDCSLYAGVGYFWRIPLEKCAQLARALSVPCQKSYAYSVETVNIGPSLRQVGSCTKVEHGVQPSRRREELPTEEDRQIGKSIYDRLEFNETIQTDCFPTSLWESPLRQVISRCFVIYVQHRGQVRAAKATL